MFQALDSMFKFPSMHFPRMDFPKFPKFSAKDFSGGRATMSTTKFHCVNGVCNGQVLIGLGECKIDHNFRESGLAGV